MRGSGGVRLSQCMIVKDEEKNIRRALSWGKDFLYEQIVVDTGSTDRTVEIARSMGAKVYHFEWIDDFAAAKNYAISKARGDWIAFLDADEYFPPEDAQKLMPLLEKLNLTKYSVMLTSWMQLSDEGEIFSGDFQVRIFRRQKGLWYRNRIHEELRLDGEEVSSLTVDASKELAIFHTGYSQEASKDRRKAERNFRLLELELSERPEDREVMGYLGDAYYAMEELGTAKEWYRRAIDRMPEQIDEYDVKSPAFFWKLMTIYAREADETALMELYGQGVRRMPKEPDFDCTIGFYFTLHKDFERGAQYLARALEKQEKYGGNNRGAYTRGQLDRVYRELALCFLNMGELEKAVAFSLRVLKDKPSDREALLFLTQALEARQSYGEEED